MPKCVRFFFLPYIHPVDNRLSHVDVLSCRLSISAIAFVWVHGRHSQLGIRIDVAFLLHSHAGTENVLDTCVLPTLVKNSLSKHFQHRGTVEITFRSRGTLAKKKYYTMYDTLV